MRASAGQSAEHSRGGEALAARIETAGIDAVDFGVGRYFLDLLLEVDFEESLQAKFAREFVEAIKSFLGEDIGHQENGVCSICASLIDLIRIDNELLSKHGLVDGEFRLAQSIHGHAGAEITLIR